MGSIVVALPKFEDAKHISEILMRRGLTVTAVCTTASNTLTQVRQLDSGVLICGARFSDMHYTQLADYLPESFEMLLLAGAVTAEHSPPGIMTLALPLKAAELVSTVEMMLQQQERCYRKRKNALKKRSAKEQKYIDDAKRVLMDRNNMTEPEAFRYIQKCSMDSGTNMVETAQMILLMIYDE